MSNKHQDIENAENAGQTVNIGHNNFLLTRRIVAILESGSLPMKRLRERASEKNLLVDATAGRKMRSLIVTDSHHVILSALGAQTLQERLHGSRHETFKGRPEWEEGEFVS